MVKTKSQKVLGAHSYVCKGYRWKKLPPPIYLFREKFSPIYPIYPKKQSKSSENVPCSRGWRACLRAYVLVWLACLVCSCACLFVCLASLLVLCLSVLTCLTCLLWSSILRACVLSVLVCPIYFIFEKFNSKNCIEKFVTSYRSI